MQANWMLHCVDPSGEGDQWLLILTSGRILGRVWDASGTATDRQRKPWRRRKRRYAACLHFDLIIEICELKISQFVGAKRKTQHPQSFLVLMHSPVPPRYTHNWRRWTRVFECLVFKKFNYTFRTRARVGGGGREVVMAADVDGHNTYVRPSSRQAEDGGSWVRTTEYAMVEFVMNENKVRSGLFLSWKLFINRISWSAQREEITDLTSPDGRRCFGPDGAVLMGNACVAN